MASYSAVHEFDTYSFGLIYFREKYHDQLKPVADQALKKLSLQGLLENEFIQLEQYHTVEISVDYYEEEPDMLEMVQTTIELLGDPCKQLLELFYFEHHSWETIAYVMNYSSAAIARNQKYKCLERLREQLRY
ncbi:MAG TPA: sigma-70 family RNA polymerase sigma factor [Mariniphaga anaerophila]|uniref:Sigma-70 family RNA polymerase sigma factor n=1 Tax=Mariniphaga anaerophila TaxID=1484053 RepID=A0A831LSH5_9BACT|nr:sigma-70 family RNA polymerase sigma factor [Mariniphaga anaerophila]